MMSKLHKEMECDPHTSFLAFISKEDDVSCGQWVYFSKLAVFLLVCFETESHIAQGSLKVAK